MRLGVDPVHFGLILTLNLMIGLLHPPLGMVLFVLSRVAKLSVERTTMAILPWLVPLFIALFVITFIPAGHALAADQARTDHAMTTALAATLYGAKDLRLEDRELAPLAPGFVRVRFAAGGICGSDMHYFSHGRIGNFIATSPLVLGHEVAGTVEEVGEGVTGVAPGAPRRGQPLALVRPLPALPRRPAQPLREHLLHGLGLEDPAHAGRLRHPLRRHPRPVHPHPRRHALRGRRPLRAPRRLPARRQPRQGRRASTSPSSAPARSAS